MAEKAEKAEFVAKRTRSPDPFDYIFPQLFLHDYGGASEL